MQTRSIGLKSIQQGYLKLTLALVLVLVTLFVCFVAYDNFKSQNASQTNNATDTASVDTQVVKQTPTQNKNTSVDNQSAPSFFGRLFSSNNDKASETESGSNDLDTGESDNSIHNQMSAKEYQQWAEQAEQSVVALSAQSDELPSVSGKVLDLDGHPVAGMQVSARLRRYNKSENSVPESALPTHRATTNANGFYAFKELPKGIYLLKTEEKDGYKQAQKEVTTGVKYANLTVRTASTLLVNGTVQTPAGTPLSNVRVVPLISGLARAVNSDEAGQFNFTVTLDGDSITFPVKLEHPDYRETHYKVGHADWDNDALRFVVTMQPQASLIPFSGTLKSKSGQPVAGEVVRLSSGTTRQNYQAATNSAGEFFFNEVEIADDYVLWVRPRSKYKDYSEKNISLNTLTTSHEIALEPLGRSYRVTGRIVDSNNQPVPNYSLYLKHKLMANMNINVISDSQGNFVLNDVPEGDVVFKTNTMPFYTISGLKLAGDSAERNVTLNLAKGDRKLLGKVIDSQGNPIAAPKIFITSSRNINGLNSKSSRTTSTDADGQFVFTELSQGQHTITVNAPGYRGARLRHMINGNNELVVRLERS